MVGRHGDTTDYAGPGPGTYNVMGLSSRGKWFSMGANKLVVTKIWQHDIRILIRYMFFNCLGKSSAPSASMHYRHAEPKSFVTPAPGAVLITDLLFLSYRI